MKPTRVFLFLAVAILFPFSSAWSAPIKLTGKDVESYWSSIADHSIRTSTAPRLKGADPESGEGMLETFATRFLPNAYANYQEIRATAKEREQLLSENFPQGRPSDPSGGALYDKVSKACSKAVAEMFRRHDELAHFYLLHEAGLIEDSELSALDAKPILQILPSEGDIPEPFAGRPAVPSQDERGFAEKYIPESWAEYQRLASILSDGAMSYSNLRRDAILIDAPRATVVLSALGKRLEEVSTKLDATLKEVGQRKLLHAVGEASASDLAESDETLRAELMDFASTLSIKDRVTIAIEEDITLQPVVLKKRIELFSVARKKNPILPAMVLIPGENFAIGQYEVTQAQWEAVMGENPSRFQGADNPVENVSWDDCQEFLKKLNALPAVKESGLTFRLPTDAEWEYACRAGATGDYCCLSNGTEITADMLGRVAWFKDNSDSKTHPVGQKEPNSFGLYDMHGNVREWTSTAFNSGHVDRGGSWDDSARDCGASDWNRYSPSWRLNLIGFRLCASGRAD